MITINTDAHHIDHFDFMKYGVGTAQKVGLKNHKLLMLNHVKHLKNGSNQQNKVLKEEGR